MGTPFDALLCERGLTYEMAWADGFAAAHRFIELDPKLARKIDDIVAVAGDWTALGLPYDAWHEGLVHGIYGEFDYQRKLNADRARN